MAKAARSPNSSDSSRNWGFRARSCCTLRLPLRAIASMMADADLGVVPKRNDSFGGDAFSTKILEFMALGVPLLVADTRIDRHYFNDHAAALLQVRQRRLAGAGDARCVPGP